MLLEHMSDGEAETKRRDVRSSDVNVAKWSQRMGFMFDILK